VNSPAFSGTTMSLPVVEGTGKNNKRERLFKKQKRE
jgi:hypothetical protein